MFGGDVDVGLVGWWHDVPMLVSPLPGVDRDGLLDALRLLHSKVSNLRAGPATGGSYRWLSDYLGWANEAARMLRSQIRATDIDRLVLTKRYELLLSMVAGVRPEGDRVSLHDVPVRPGQHAVVNDLLVTELEERTGAFEEACKVLDQQIVRWSRPGMFVGLDTSVYLTHPDKLEDLDIADLAKVRGDDLHVLVPMVVIEELDGLKQRGDNHARWRAAHTLAVLDKVLARPTEPARLRAADFSALQSGGIPRGEVSVELLFDPLRHVRLSVNDDEIIDRLLAAQSLAARPITLITYDTNQSFKARAAGLRVSRLPMPIENEPEPVAKQRGGGRRKDRGPEREDGHSSS